MDKDLEAPCAGCTNYSNWVTMTMYKKPQHGPQTLQEAIDDWYNEGQDQLQEDFWTTPDPQYDVVSKPKHYMLFDADYVNSTAYLKEGIEVRDVIEKLVNKIPPVSRDYGGLFTADYVQMMQYLMRFMDKNGVEDLKKARWYLDKLIDSYDKPDF
jgi:outer membrane protein assembly factor BamD (BamD/ComL family)